MTRYRSWLGKVTVVLLSIAFSAVSLDAQSFQLQNEALQAVTRFISDNCQRPIPRGTLTTTELGGEIDLRLQGLAKAIAGVGGKGKGEVQKVSWEGTALTEFAKAVESGNKCAVDMAHLLASIGMIPRADDVDRVIKALEDSSGGRNIPAGAGRLLTPRANAEVLKDDFSTPGNWWIGDGSSRYGRFRADANSGKYTWSIWFNETVSSFPVIAPFPSAIDFGVAVDVEFPTFRFIRPLGCPDYRAADQFAAGLIFGRLDGAEYLFRIGRQDGVTKYALHRYDERGFTTVLDWNPISLDLKTVNRLSVTVVGGSAKMSVNDKVVDEIQLRDFRGGRVGLDATGTSCEALQVRFDNFEFRRTSQPR